MCSQNNNGGAYLQIPFLELTVSVFIGSAIWLLFGCGIWLLFLPGVYSYPELLIILFRSSAQCTIIHLLLSVLYNIAVVYHI